MKSLLKLYLLLFSSLTLFGCAAFKNPTTAINIDIIRQQPGVELTTSIGEIFFEQEVTTGVKDNLTGFEFISDVLKIELVVKSANKSKLVLDYSEFMKSRDRNGWVYTNGQWTKRPAFDKTLEFDLSDSNMVFFKNTTFEIIEIKGGRIKYKRINSAVK